MNTENNNGYVYFYNIGNKILFLLKYGKILKIFNSLTKG